MPFPEIRSWMAGSTGVQGRSAASQVDGSVLSPARHGSIRQGQTLLISVWVCAARRVIAVFFLSILLMATAQLSSGERGYVTHLQHNTCGVMALCLLLSLKWNRLSTGFISRLHWPTDLTGFLGRILERTQWDHLRDSLGPCFLAPGWCLVRYRKINFPTE